MSEWHGKMVKIKALYTEDGVRLNENNNRDISQIHEEVIKGVYVKPNFMTLPNGTVNKSPIILGYSSYDVDQKLKVYPIVSRKELQSLSGAKLPKELSLLAQELFKHYVRLQGESQSTSVFPKLATLLNKANNYEYVTVKVFYDFQEYQEKRGKTKNSFQVIKYSNEEVMILNSTIPSLKDNQYKPLTIDSLTKILTELETLFYFKPNKLSVDEELTKKMAFYKNVVNDFNKHNTFNQLKDLTLNAQEFVWNYLTVNSDILGYRHYSNKDSLNIISYCLKHLKTNSKPLTYSLLRLKNKLVFGYYVEIDSNISAYLVKDGLFYKESVPYSFFGETYPMGYESIFEPYVDSLLTPEQISIAEQIQTRTINLTREYQQIVEKTDNLNTINSNIRAELTRKGIAKEDTIGGLVYLLGTSLLGDCITPELSETKRFTYDEQTQMVVDNDNIFVGEYLKIREKDLEKEYEDVYYFEGIQGMKGFIALLNDANTRFKGWEDEAVGYFLFSKYIVTDFYMSDYKSSQNVADLMRSADNSFDVITYHKDFDEDDYSEGYEYYIREYEGSFRLGNIEFNYELEYNKASSDYTFKDIDISINDEDELDHLDNEQKNSDNTHKEFMTKIETLLKELSEDELSYLRFNEYKGETLGENIDTLVVKIYRDE